jgi:hypothetical protein
MREKERRGCSPRLRGSLLAGADHFKTVRRLNGHCVAFLAEVSRAGRQGPGFAFFDADRELWAAADARVMARVASCPTLLLDLNLRGIGSGERAPGPGGLLALPRSGLASPDQAVPLVREILMEAWSATRSKQGAANLVFGIGPSASATVAGLGASDLEQVVTACASHLRPRWEERPGFWRTLLRAAVGSDDQILQKVHLHCLQLLGSELISG